MQSKLSKLKVEAEKEGLVLDEEPNRIENQSG
jgi:hypothetical protein